MLKTFKKLYLNTYFRVPLKFVITLSISKFLHDLFQWYLLGKEIRIPRYMDIYASSNQLNPPFPIPYPYNHNYQTYKMNKEYFAFVRRFFDTYYKDYAQQKYILVDHPCRQNPDSVDLFIQYGGVYRIQETMKYSFLNKMKKQGVQIPEGINQKLRQLHQYRVDAFTPIVPLL